MLLTFEKYLSFFFIISLSEEDYDPYWKIETLLELITLSLYLGPSTFKSQQNFRINSDHHYYIFLWWS